MASGLHQRQHRAWLVLADLSGALPGDGAVLPHAVRRRSFWVGLL
jgi:hypothetical protein